MRLYSAVVDPHGPFPLQAERLVWSLVNLAGVSAEQIILHVVGAAPPTIQRSLNRLGVELVQVDAWPGNSFCNKLQQLPSLLERDWQDVVLLDCDVIVLEDLPRADGMLRGKMVDLPNPPEEILEAIFADAHLPLRKGVTDIDRLPTAWANCNGGVYVIDRALMSSLASAWTHWARWSLAKAELFQTYTSHVDQVSFAMAVASEGLPFEPLHHRWNFPSHLEQAALRDCEPAVIHYHRSTDEAQFLRPLTGLPLLNEAISRINDALLTQRRDTFDNTAFWTSRYAMHPELGSGIGSRGASLAAKRALLSEVVNLLSPRSIADVGSGDGESIALVPERIFVCGHDVAPSSEEIYRSRRQNSDWLVMDICRSPLSAESWDLIVCLDVLIHFADQEDYRRAVTHLLQADSPVLVSGFDTVPVEFGPMTYFHEPLSRTIESHGWTPVPVGAYRGLTVYLSLPPDYILEEFGIPDDLVRSAVTLVNDPLLMLKCIRESVERLGFFPHHLPRLIEYPWILGQVSDRDGLRIADAGAGISVLPLMLANSGHDVITFDSHALVRTRLDRDRWNEWGFLDYSTIDPRITSEHIDYESSKATDLDAVVSVSVIEHLTRAVRMAWFKKAFVQLKPQGRLLLTIDTHPFTSEVWNYSEGTLVEDTKTHGTIDELIMDITNAGFVVLHTEENRHLPKTRVALVRIVAEKVRAHLEKS